MKELLSQTPTRSRLGELFSEDRQFWPMASLLLGTVSLLKGIRPPSLWAATQGLVNYDHGFVKRGLFGAATGSWLHGERYANFAMFSYIALAVLVCLLVALIVRSGVAVTLGNGEPIAVFAASFAVTFVAHLVGYTDIICCGLAVVLLLVKNTTVRFMAAIPLAVAGILIHEMFLVVFLPVLLLSLVVDGIRRPAMRKISLMMSAALVVLCVGLTVKLAWSRPLPAVEVAAMQAESAAKADFAVRPDFFLVMVHSTIDNLRLAKSAISVKIYRRWWVESVVELAPTIGLLSYAIVLAVNRLADGRTRIWLGVGAIVAAMAPVAMNLQGIDVVRFNSWAAVDCLLVLAVVCPGSGELRLPLPAWYRNATVLTVALSMAAGEGLMDHRGVNPYPFSEGFFHTVRSLDQQQWEPPV